MEEEGGGGDAENEGKQEISGRTVVLADVCVYVFFERAFECVSGISGTILH